MLLSNMHLTSKKLLAWVILPLITFAFAFFGIQGYLHQGGGQDKVASVDGVAIHTRELNDAFERLRRQELENNRNLNHSLDKQLKQRALEMLITQKLLKQAAINAGFDVSLQAAEQALTQIPAFQENGQFSQGLFQQMLYANRYTTKSFLKELRSNMIVHQLQSGLMSSAFVLPTEVDRSIALVDQKRDIDYLLIPLDKFNQNTKIPEQQLQAYYDSHKSKFKTEEKVSVEYVQLSSLDMLKSIKISEKQLQDYYNDNKDNFKTSPKWQVAQILVKVPQNPTDKQLKAVQEKLQTITKAIEKGESFTALVKKYSDDVLSVKDNGKLPWFGLGTLDANFEHAVAALKKVGDISVPVQTKYGYNIIKLLAKKPAKQIPFAKVKENILQSLTQDKAQKEFATANDTLASLSFSNPDSLTETAKALKLPIKTTALFTQAGGKDSVTSNKKIIHTAYSADVLAGNNSDVIQFDKNSVIVLRVKKHLPASFQTFAEVRASILAKLKQEAMQSSAKTYAEKIIAQNEKHLTDQKLLAKYKLTWRSENDLTRYDPKLNKVITKTAFDLAKPSKTLSQPTKSVLLDSKELVIVKLRKVHPADIATIPQEQRKLYQQQMANSYGALEYELYVKGLSKSATIKRNNQI